MATLNRSASAGKKLISKTLRDMPKKIIANFSQPLLLADYLLSCLEDDTDRSNQVFALKGLFLLIQNHGLDCPKYYEKLYKLLLPQRVKMTHGISTRSVFSLDLDTKSRFCRLFDLSLRSSALPSKMIASFIKRLARLVVTHGVVYSLSDTMYVVSQIANLIHRHPRCYRLIHRKKTSISLGLRLSNDPYLEEEEDPLKTMAMKSSLWELEVIMKQHSDQRIRDFCKVFKSDVVSRTSFNIMKCETYASADPLDLLKQDL